MSSIPAAANTLRTKHNAAAGKVDRFFPVWGIDPSVNVYVSPKLPVTPEYVGGTFGMTRFIVISFVFLAFAFYELSGGADFDPEETRLARIDVPEAGDAPAVTTDVADASVAAPRPAPISEEVTRVSLNLSSVNDVLRPASTLRTQPAVQRASVPVEETAAVSEEEPVIILPSLLVDRPVITPVDFGDDSAVQTIAANPAATEVRQVTGRSVNVRGGPGTDYSVVDRLVRGDRVEVLQDPGNGWVRLRPVGGGTVGWMADFLLSEG